MSRQLRSLGASRIYACGFAMFVAASLLCGSAAAEPPSGVESAGHNWFSELPHLPLTASFKPLSVGTRVLLSDDGTKRLALRLGCFGKLHGLRLQATF